MTIPRTLADRIVDTLEARTRGLLPADFDEQMAADVDAMAARYEELRLRMGFSAADRQVKTEFVARLLAGEPQPAADASWTDISIQLPAELTIVEVRHRSGKTRQDWLERVGDACCFSYDGEDPVIAWRPTVGEANPDVAFRLQRTMRRKAGQSHPLAARQEDPS